MTAGSISAVLPAYNESAVIAGVARAAHDALRRAGVDTFEVVVVDDGSTDDTALRVRQLAVDLPEVRLVSHAHNRGYGAALRTGFDVARHQTIWLMDSDGQFDPADLSLLLPLLQPGTLVAGYRAHRSDPWPRRLNHAAFFAVVRAVLGPTVRDVNCAFKLFPRELGLGLSSEGAMISTELVLRARQDGYRILQVPVPHHPRRAGTATGANPRVVLRAFGELWRMRRATPRRR